MEEGKKEEGSEGRADAYAWKIIDGKFVMKKKGIRFTVTPGSGDIVISDENAEFIFGTRMREGEKKEDAGFELVKMTTMAFDWFPKVSLEKAYEIVGKMEDLRKEGIEEFWKA